MSACVCACVWEGSRQTGTVCGTEGKGRGEVQEHQGGAGRSACVCMFACGVGRGGREREGRDKKRKWGMGGGQVMWWGIGDDSREHEQKVVGAEGQWYRTKRQEELVLKIVKITVNALNNPPV